jgi:hypothetical protein
MSAPTRIYVVTPKTGDTPPRLVRATHPTHAIRHVADAAYSVAVASQDDLVAAFERGIKVEALRHEQPELPIS